MPEVGIEPTWSCDRRILSPLRLPVSPLRQSVNRRRIPSPKGDKLSGEEAEVKLPVSRVAPGEKTDGVRSACGPTRYLREKFVSGQGEGHIGRAPDVHDSSLSPDSPL